jgi:hypothetical protein
MKWPIASGNHVLATRYRSLFAGQAVCCSLHACWKAMMVGEGEGQASTCCYSAVNYRMMMMGNTFAWPVKNKVFDVITSCSNQI